MNNFKINNKVALVTGGASGIGKQFVINLLKNGAKGVSIADVSEKDAQALLEYIEETFGKNRAIFVKTDVTNRAEFKNAFEETIKKFQTLDILINNAGIFSKNAEKLVAVNLHGPINGTYLGFEEYLPKFRSTNEAVIINISSVYGISYCPHAPVYAATKFGVLGLSLSFGSPEHFEKSGIRVITVCPGFTNTGITDTINQFSGTYLEILKRLSETAIFQEPEIVGAKLMKIIEDAPSGTAWIIEEGKTYEYKMRDRLEEKEKAN